MTKPSIIVVSETSLDTAVKAVLGIALPRGTPEVWSWVSRDQPIRLAAEAEKPTFIRIWNPHL